MGVLLWLAVPVLATALAVFLLARRNRAATPEQQQQGISEMQRFQEAMSKPLPPRKDLERPL
mgnify:CR=1 FL=1